LRRASSTTRVSARAAATRRVSVASHPSSWRPAQTPSIMRRAVDATDPRRAPGDAAGADGHDRLGGH
jgi:hypothetical protein